MHETFGSFGVLSPAETDPELLPFMGFFSPSMDGSLVSLINSTKPGHWERESRSAGGLAELRFMGLENLEKYKVDELHAYAEWIAHEAVAREKPFGLYLRNFLLGAEVIEGRDDPQGGRQMLTMTTPDDGRMQQFLADQSVESLIPFISIANRAIDLSAIPSLVFSNDNWERGAEILVQHAAVIVLFFLTLTPGVDREIDLLRAAEARERTLIVVADEDPRETTDMLFQLFKNRETEDSGEPGQADRKEWQPERRTPPSDFPHQVRLGSEPDDWKLVTETFNALARKAEPSRQRELPPLPPPDRPSRELLDRARARAVQELELATQCMEKGDGIAAEDALMRSIAFSHWSRDRLERAMAFTHLGSVERFLLKYPNEAVQSYLMALDLFETLLPTSETASQIYEPLVRQLATYLEELGDPNRAKAVLARLEKSNISGAR